MPRPKKGERTPGSGRKVGYKAAKTLEKEAARVRLRELVIQHLDPMTLAQIDHAKGVSYMVVRNPDGTFTRATDEVQIDAALKAGKDTFKIFTQAPNTSAYTDLMNRALDKPAEQVQVSGPEGGPLEIVIKAPWRESKK